VDFLSCEILPGLQCKRVMVTRAQLHPYIM
jgi:hypothetical protein